MPDHETDYREVEAKFAVDAAAREALMRLDEVAGFKVVSRTEKPQADIYFDTSDGDLEKAGATLRVRQLTNGSLMTFKSDAQLAANDGEAHFASRIEDETPISDEDASRVSLTGALPDSIDVSPLQRARRITVDGTLQPIALIENKRTVVGLVDAEGSLIELAIDHARGTRLRDQRTIEFDEVELETKSASRDTLSRVARELERRIPGLRPSQETKLGRTLL